MRKPTISEYRDLYHLSDSIDYEKYVIINYKILPAKDMDITDVAAEIALISSVGTLRTLPYENKSDRLKCSALILDAKEPGPDGFTFVSVAYPLQLFSGNDGITQLLGVATFSAEYRYTSEFRIEGFRLPRSFLDRFPGPKYGMQGIKDIFNIRSRPLFGAILKPRMGVPLNIICEKASQALLGGADFLVDDELLTDQEGELSFDRRVSALTKIARDLSAITKEKKMYIPNITSTPFRCLEYAKKGLSFGAEILLINGYTMGLPGLQDICENADVDAAIITCNLGNAILVRNTDATGMSPASIARLSRIAGADAVHTGISSAEWFANDAWGPSITSLTDRLGNLKSSIPVAAGGFSIANTWDNIQDLGIDCILEAGSGVFAFSGGPKDACRGIRMLLEELEPDMDNVRARSKIKNLATKYDFIKSNLAQFGYKHS
jgi:ribulose-bisphosphate carboxylase large chain